VPRANVLIVEDSAPDAMLLKIALDAAGLDYKLTALRDGAQALEYVRLQRGREDSELPDIILLDVNVPKVSGLEVLQEIRRIEALASVPVLVLSSALSPRDESTVMSVDGARLETKPSDLDGYLELGRTIRISLQNSRKFAASGGKG
jgi:CheY-like chemotaxis protein